MSTKITPGGKRLTDRMSTTSDQLQGKGNDQLKKAGASAQQALDHGQLAAGLTLDANADGMNAVADTMIAGGHAAAGAALAAAGAIVKASELVGDLLGAALQHVGKTLIHVGNFLRKIGGGAQIVVRELESAGHGRSLGDRLLHRSKAQFGMAGNALGRALDDLIASGGNLKNAAAAVLEAATHIADAAAHGGAGAALHTSAAAVQAARLAVQAVQAGTDGAGGLLQQAGMAVIAAGNAVNAPSGMDTAVAVKP